MTIFQTLYWRVINATRYSLQGMKAAYQSEMAFRLDLIIFGVNTVVLFFIHNPYFTMWLFFCGLFVLFAELANTALETIVNWISLERHPAAGKAKDIGSALVFLSLVNLIISWFFYLIKF